MSNEYQKQRILIVDDETTNIKLLADALKPDYTILFALNGKDALKIMQGKELPDLILLDIMMPGIDGYEVCMKLKSKQRTRNIPIIFITAMSEVEDETKGLEIGAVDYITKPFSMAIVKARVRTHMELKRHRDILEHVSSFDGLTGIANRRRFDEAIAQEWKRALRESSRISLIMIDIDHFKLFNDNYGHQAGDDCLRRVAAALAESVRRPSDMVARYGGEEFAAILPKTDRDGALFIAETMRNAVESMSIPNLNAETAGHLTVSVGTATASPSSSLSANALISASDKALYQAKNSGRNQVKSLVMD